MEIDLNKAVQFIKSKARTVDLAVYEYFFEGKSNKQVIAELEKYQNPDGGFGHGLEADFWNPNSSPIATNDALITLMKTNALEDAKDMVQGIIRYLESHDSFDEKKKCWQFAIESNRDYPHAIWWEKDGDGVMGYNPTASLATFLVCYGKRNPYYEEIVQSSIKYLKEMQDLSADSLKCFLLSYQMLKKNGIWDVVNLDEFKALLSERIETSICKDTNRYGVEYATVPSDIFTGMYHEFFASGIRELAHKELEILERLQQDDGGFDITWKWNTDYSEFEQARDMWRPKITIDKLLFLRMNEKGL